jgi:2-epi-5-epi-valiolone synthase
MDAELQVQVPDAVAHDEPKVAAVHLEMRARREVRYSIIHTQRPVFHAEETAISTIVGDREVLLVVDRNVDGIYGQSFRIHAKRHLNLADIVVIDGDEAHKTWRQTEAICNVAMGCGLARNAVIIGVGGGVVLDISGFAASIYRRGIGYLRIPTTLIGQVDVSVGVKQGVNSGRFKNVLGSFYPPLASINDASFLKTLSAPLIAAGFAEIIKMAVIADPILFGLVEQFGRVLLASRFQQPSAAALAIMMRAEASMLRELEGNLFETNLLRPVDFGHTFSVALETDSSYALLHGHAVGLDMLISTCLAVRRALCSETVLERMLAIYRQVELPLSQRICSAQRLHESLASVRKHRGGALNLVAPTDIGRPIFLQDVSIDELKDTLDFLADAQLRHDRSGL